MKKNVGSFRKFVKAGADLGFDPFDDPRKMSCDLDYGLREAAAMLWNSLDEGRHGPNVKYSSVRATRSMATNVQRTLAARTAVPCVLRDGAWRREMSCLPTDSLWFGAFNNGFRARMGISIKQDYPLTPGVVLEVLSACEDDWQDARMKGVPGGGRSIAEQACFFALTYVAGLRSFEVPKIVLSTLKHSGFVAASGETPAHIGIPLTGQFKGRGSVAVNVIVFVVEETKSGVKLGKWLRRLIMTLGELEVETGWLFQKGEARPQTTSDFGEFFYTRLTQAMDKRPELFEAGVDIHADYGPTRSGRRGANTELIRQRVKTDDLNWFFRWNTGGGETSSLPMHVLYAERRALAPRFLHISKQL